MPCITSDDDWGLCRTELIQSDPSTSLSSSWSGTCLAIAGLQTSDSTLAPASAVLAYCSGTGLPEKSQTLAFSLSHRVNRPRLNSGFL